MKRRELAETILNKINELSSDEEKIEYLETYCNEVVDHYWLNHYLTPVSEADGRTYTVCSLCGNSGVINSNCFTPSGLKVEKKVFCICPNGQSLRKMGRDPNLSYCPEEKDFK